MKTVLLTDDEPNVQSALRRLLRPEGWNLLFANQGCQALDILQRQAVDAVVSELRLPDMDGVGLLQQVQARYPRVARMVLSGYLEETRHQAAADCAQLVLYKPWDGERVRGGLRQLLHADAPMRRALTA